MTRCNELSCEYRSWWKDESRSEGLDRTEAAGQHDSVQLPSPADHPPQLTECGTEHSRKDELMQELTGDKC